MTGRDGDLHAASEDGRKRHGYQLGSRRDKWRVQGPRAQGSHLGHHTGDTLSSAHVSNGLFHGFPNTPEISFVWARWVLSSPSASSTSILVRRRCRSETTDGGRLGFKSGLGPEARQPADIPGPSKALRGALSGSHPRYCGVVQPGHPLEAPGISLPMDPLPPWFGHWTRLAGAYIRLLSHCSPYYATWFSRWIHRALQDPGLEWLGPGADPPAPSDGRVSDSGTVRRTPFLGIWMTWPLAAR